MEDYEIEECDCPKCGHHTLHSRDCNNIFCEEGFIDDSEDDPINNPPGMSEHRCEECRGTGVERWCPNCGTNLSGVKLNWPEDNIHETPNLINP